MTFFFSPLEQFLILPIPGLESFFLNFDTLFFTYGVIIFLAVVYIFSILKSNSLLLIPNRWQLFFETNFLGVSIFLQDNIHANARRKFFPIVGVVFLFILYSNLFGILPFTFTITSQLVVTFAISLFCFIGIQIIAIKKNKLKFFASFFPSGVPVMLSLLLVPIEFLSFFFKPISLSIRLFANMMAGHTLLKVIAGFVCLIMGINNVYSIGHFASLLVLVILFLLEVAVAAIQSFVFAVLICIYISEVFNAH